MKKLFLLASMLVVAACNPAVASNCGNGNDHGNGNGCGGDTPASASQGQQQGQAQLQLQGQQQGQAQSSYNSNHNSNANSNSNHNTNLNYNNTTSHSNAYSGSVSGAVAGSYSGGNTLSAYNGGNSINGGNVNVETKVRPAASAPALALTSSGTDTCMGSISGSAGSGFFSLGLGGTKESDECNHRANARMLMQFGQPEAALALLCLNADVEKVTPACPGHTKQPEHQAKAQPQAELAAVDDPFHTRN